MFALCRIPEGGCILADEVGLGKTIEAGRIIAQLLAEGASRILIVVPRPLVGQWQSELHPLLAIEALEASDTNLDIAAPGVFRGGHEYAGGRTGSGRLKSGPPFDLCLIDETHEVFAGVYRRFDRHGVCDEARKQAGKAHRVREVIGAAPVVLMTATPIQNSLSELRGLIQYIDPSGTLLGAKPGFEGRLPCGQGRSCGRRRAGDRAAPTLEHRRPTNAPPAGLGILDQPFVGRRAHLFGYRMSEEERQFYDDITPASRRAPRPQSGATSSDSSFEPRRDPAEPAPAKQNHFYGPDPFQDFNLRLTLNR